MGNQSSFESHSDLSDLATNYTYTTKFNDTRFGAIKLLERKDNSEKIFQKDYSSNIAKEFEDYVQKITKSVPLAHQNILKVIGYNSIKDNLLCADYYKVSLFFEHFETDLEKEIYRRSVRKNYFTETELRCLLDSVISAGAFFQKNEVAHGDIKPFNIFITANQEYKICDRSLFQSVYNPTYFGLLEGLEAKSHYPSPQVFKYYGEKTVKTIDFDIYKNDVYGLGMSVLMAAQLEKIDNAYDYNNKKINYDAIGKALEKLRQRYSENFIESLKILLDPHESRRPDFIQLDDEIKDYRADLRAHAKLERTLEAQKKQSFQSPVSSVHKRSVTATTIPTPPSHTSFDDEIDKKVRRAVEKSETNINRVSSRIKNDILDGYVHTYLRKDPLPQDPPLLKTIAPHLTMRPRLTPVLKIFSPEKGRVSVSRHSVMNVSQNLFGSPERVAQSFYYSPERDSQEGRLQPPLPNGSFAGNTSLSEANFGTPYYQSVRCERGSLVPEMMGL